MQICLLVTTANSHSALRYLSSAEPKSQRDPMRLQGLRCPRRYHFGSNFPKCLGWLWSLVRVFLSLEQYPQSKS